MTSSTSWNDVVNKIKGVSNKGALNWSGSNTTYTVSAGYYTGGTLDSRTSYNNGYSAGRTQGRNDVKNSPNSYSLYTKSQYDTNYNNGYNKGKSDANTIQTKSGSGSTSSNTVTMKWNGGSGNYKTINVGNLGFQPVLCAMYCTSSGGNMTIRFGNTIVVHGNSLQNITNYGSFSWTSSSCVMPTLRTASVTYNWYAAGYN